MAVFFLGGLVLAGCSPFSTERPPLPDSTFAHLLVEMHLVRGRAEPPRALPMGFPERVLRQHQVTRTEFDATMRHYSRHPKAFEALYNRVIDTLSAVQQRTLDRRAEADTSRRGAP